MIFERGGQGDVQRQTVFQFFEGQDLEFGQGVAGADLDGSHRTVAGDIAVEIIIDPQLIANDLELKGMICNIGSLPIPIAKKGGDLVILITPLEIGSGIKFIFCSRTADGQ